MNFIQQMKPTFGNEEKKACIDYMESDGYITEHKKTKELELAISKFTNSKYCFMVNNGTISLSIALLAMGITKNDEVIIPNLTMVATANSILLIGAIPIFVDVDSDGLIDCKKINISKNTKAIIYVSLNGRSSNIYDIKKLCEDNRIFLLEDAAQSLGSYYDNRHVGTFGNIGSFSFSTPKIISMGQGGALITDDDILANNIKRIKDFGREKSGSDDFITFGINSKFTDLQAVIGIEQMKKLNKRIIRKKEIWNQYYNNLKDIDNIKFLNKNINPDEKNWLPWFIDIYTTDRDELSKYLYKNNIGTRKIYKSLHKETTYKNLINSNDKYHISDNLSDCGLWLPSYIELTNNEIDYICNTILNFYK